MEVEEIGEVDLKTYLDRFNGSYVKISISDKTEETVTGWVNLKLYKGSIRGAGSYSPYSLYNESIASFTTGELYDHKDAQGFITLFGLPLKVRAMMEQSVGEGQAVVKSKKLKKRPTE